MENIKINIPFFNLKLRIHENTEKIFRYIALIGFIAFSALWLITGFEGTLYQLFFPKHIIGLGGIHYLVLVLMPLFYYVCSYHLSKNGVHKLRNIIYSFIFSTGFVNATFELMWIVFYDYFHNFGRFYITFPFLYGRGFMAWWVFLRTFYWLIFGFIFMYFIKQYYGFKWRLDNTSKWLFFGTVWMWCYWVLAPFNFQVVRGAYFPQYIYAEYTPDLTYIIPVYVKNTTIFIINTLTKLLHFLFVGYVFMPKFGDS